MKQRLPKFRVWDYIDEKMYNVLKIDFDLGIIYCEKFLSTGERRCVTREMQDIDLMQNTGLKDDNGVEIYEGDIVRLPNDDICEIQYRLDYNYSGFVATSITLLHGIKIYEHWKAKEVIGNIYENPSSEKRK
jgi:uncharacterized phage protein (TIGR01671 family)